MGDYTNINLSAAGLLDPRARAAVVAVFETYAGARTDGGEGYYADEVDPQLGTLDLGAHDVRCGSAEEIASALRALVADGTEDTEGERVLVADFPWKVFEEPKYEWLGDLHVHVPGLAGDYRADCDAVGTPVVAPYGLVDVLDQAPDLASARQQVRTIVGLDHLDALTAWPTSTAPAST